MTRVKRKSSTVRAVMMYAMTAHTLRSPAVGSAVVPAGSSAARYCKAQLMMKALAAAVVKNLVS